VSTKAVRYYEQLGLVVPVRRSSGYRENDVRVVTEIGELAAGGITPGKAGPFVECLYTGHRHGDECPASVAVYRASIAGLDRAITLLIARRNRLIRKLNECWPDLREGSHPR
jgi:DNA-binding transcriptional MerR regulator